MSIVQDPLADAQDQGPVALHQGGEGIFIATGHIAVQELTIRQGLALGRAAKLAYKLSNIVKSGTYHKPGPPLFRAEPLSRGHPRGTDSQSVLAIG